MKRDSWDDADDGDESRDARRRRRRRRRHGRPLSDEERAWRHAKQRAQARIGFYTHLLTYAVVCTFLLASTRGRAGLGVAFFWGIGIAFHFVSAVVGPDLRRRMIEREVERQVQRKVATGVSRERHALSDQHARSLEDLSAQVAHEIRNPITAAKSLVQQMGEDPTSGENVGYAKVALEELDRVERSVAHLLRYAREEDMRLADVSIGSVVDSALETLRERIDAQRVRLVRENGRDGVVRADAEKLRRVVINLVSNALDALAEALRRPSDPRGARGRESRGHRGLAARARQRSRHRRARARADLEPVLQLEGIRHGPRARDREEGGRGARRHDRGKFAAGRGRRVHDFAPEAARGRPLVRPRILVVEDERAIQIALAGLLGRAGYDVAIAGGGDDAIAMLEASPYDLVLTDLALGGELTGMDVLGKAKALRPESAVVMITAHGSERIAVAAMKAGAEDYVPKPFDNDQIRLVVQRALERTRLARENRLLLERVEREFGFENLIGSGAAMRRVFEAIQKVAETDLTVLVRGESGTGKELVAQALHQRSPRRDRPFVAVNCAAISAQLVESELFGHEKGAFTGADARRQGRFESASGGTIFLDEIGDMAPETQAKVLRVLQERSFERVGGTAPIEVDVRVVAATHRNLEQEVGARELPRRSLLPAARRRAVAAAAARAPRGRSRARAALPRAGLRAARARGAAPGRSRSRRARTPRLARQRARAAQRDRAGRRARERTRDRRRRSAPRRCARKRGAGRARRGQCGAPVLGGEAPRSGALRARVPARCAARVRRKHLARRRAGRHGATEPAAEDPRARTAR